MSIPENILEILYLLSAILFIMGLKLQSSADSAKKGNMMASLGMGLAIVATIVLYDGDKAGNISMMNYGIVLGGIFVGGLTGAIMAKRVAMTAMPEMVSFFNGMGGASSLVISMAEFFYIMKKLSNGSIDQIAGGDFLLVFLGLVIGGIAFSGSLVAYGKLQGKIKDYILPAQQVVNVLVLISMLVLGYFVIQTGDPLYFYIIAGLSLVYGIFFVLPIGGADMPVVISLLNSFTGIAATFVGLQSGNKAMIIGGILVGSAGTILTVLMCNAMNRSLWNVIVGNFGGGGAAGAATGEQVHREANHTDVAIMCYYAEKVYIVPGYGMAVAQAQHAVHEVDKLLEANGVTVKYGIHPVAGRMPGHMNVLLAEADVPYPKLIEMDDANPDMKTTDVVLVIGANDVVNPAANDDPSSPIYGMPILNVHESKNVIVLKRSMNPGYAGIQNPLFFKENTKMLFGDAKASMEKLAAEIKSL
ncbi:MAG: NAD(P)(+) transhydrogenase (Re/Si-specific) subunit beta [Bacteroidetes bacterium]|nr:NAD(P)(+) transhydrogenase (Re/Si-specific) subunit beta [Bacteroidota bacterium]